MTRANDDAAAALTYNRDGDRDYYAGIKRSGCPFQPGSREAGLWLKKWDAAAEHCSEVLRGSAAIVRREITIVPLLCDASRYLRDLDGSKLVRPHIVRHRDLQGRLQNELHYFPRKTEKPDAA